VQLTDLDVLPLPTGKLELRRAWPSTPDHVLLEYVGPTGQPVAGQWIRDSDQRRRVLAGTPQPAFVVPETGVLLQPAGADRKLRGLAPLLAEPGACLLSHRAERRAVVRRADGCYVKVVRPGRSDAVARAAAVAAAALAGHVDVPTLLAHDAVRGTLVWTALPGSTLHDWASTSTTSTPTAGGAGSWREAGRAIAHLHVADTDGLATRGVEDERRAATRWLAPARALGLLPDGPDVPELPAAQGLAADVVLHGDLHDKQLVADCTTAVSRIGLLDVDQLARGEAAIDVANLLVHLELRVAQLLMTPAAGVMARDAFLDGLAPDDVTLARVAVLSDLVRMRLAGLYAFRPRWRALARQLYAATVLATG
jgi:hypothetical protein